MTDATVTSLDFIDLDRGRLARRMSARMVGGAAVLAFGVTVGVFLIDERPAPAPAAAALPVEKTVPAVVVEAARTMAPGYGALFDPSSIQGPSSIVLAQVAPLASTFVFALAPPPAEQAAVEPEIVLPAPTTVAAVERMIESVPLPEPRPPELRPAAGQNPVRLPNRTGPSRSRVAVAAPAPPDNRNFLQKLFGLAPPPGPALGYAAPEEGLFGRRLTAPPTLGYDRWTAVYDIAAHTVYMPNGARLEAHSGLGDKLDDPSQVHVQNRGATPPHLYDLTPREQLFHGVQALRLNPVGGGGVFGRTGLLAHTYMLGPKGDSNGCVSFRDYDAFLQSYAAGEVRRLAVVARLN